MLTAALRRSPAFRDLSEAALAEIAGQGAGRRVEAGEALFEQGAPAHRFFLVAEGRMKVTMVTAEGKQVFVRLTGAGDFCGLALALSRPDYPATCRAAVPSFVISWPMCYWGKLLEAHPAVALRVTQAMGRHIEDVHSRLTELATEEVERRVAHAVLRLARQAGRPVEGGVDVDFPVTRQDLAEMTGTTLHSVSRIVSVWSAQGIVRRGRARIVVSDIAALEEIARGEG